MPYEGAGTIVALASARGRSALAVVRLSGPRAHEIVRRITRPLGTVGGAGRAWRAELVDGSGVFDDALVTLGAGPATYTGEDTAELSCHGNPVIVDRLVRAAIDAGSRTAEPGEFTRRAVLAGKLDLVQAEGVLQAIEAVSSRGLAVAREALGGELGRWVAGQRARLVEVAAELEARLDHPADDLTLATDDDLLAELADVAAGCDEVAATFGVGQVLVHGARVALVGPVNAGKSSLFNAMLGRTRALVHDQPGTTRDVVEATLELDGLAVTLLDTAGERETADPVEAAGLALARELVEDADALIVVLAARAGGPDAVERAILERTAGTPRVVVYNGIDRPGVAGPPPGALPISAVRGTGIEALRTALARLLEGQEPVSGHRIIASARQRDALLAVAGLALEAREALPVAGVAVAADAVTRGIEALDRLTGADSREDVLDALFARFCIGK